MKSSTFAAIFGCLVSAVVASPIHAREEQIENGLFGGNGGQFGQNGQNGVFGPGDNLVSNVFDGAACIVSSIIGGGNPRCSGKGTASVTPPTDSSNGSSNGSDDGSQSSGQYTYTYNTNPDGTLKVDITLQSGGKCTYNMQANGKDVKTVIADAAKKCIASKKQ